MPKSVVGVLFGWRNWFVKFSLFFLDFGSSILVVDSLEREREESLHLKMWKPQWFT